MILPNVQNLGFWKKIVFSQNLYDYCQCKSFCHIMDSSQTDVKNSQGNFFRTAKPAQKNCHVKEY